VPPVQRSKAAKGAQSNSPPATPTAKKLGGGWARFLVDKTTKRRESEIFCLTSDNNLQRELTKSFSNVFYKFYRFFYTLFFTVGVSYQTIFRTDKNNKHFVVFGFFFYDILTLFFFTLFLYLSYYKCISSIFTLSHLRFSLSLFYY
jgi:hypothetical protein